MDDFPDMPFFCLDFLLCIYFHSKSFSSLCVTVDIPCLCAVGISPSDHVLGSLGRSHNFQRIEIGWKKSGSLIQTNL